MISASLDLAFSSIRASYEHPVNCPRCGGFNDIVAIDLSGYEQVFLNMAKDVYEGKIKPSDLNRELITKTYGNLNEAAGSSFGKLWEPTKTDPPSRAALLMQRNLYAFSGAKTYSMMLELNSGLNKNGQQVSFEDFKKAALKLNNKYNVNYLQAEYQTAQHSGKMAANWEAYQRNSKRFPNLKYKTQEDERVRDEHAHLNDTIAPLGSDFWKNFYPPNGWRCRCFTVQTAAAPTVNIPTTVPEIKPEFHNNVGLSNQVFQQDGKTPHKFFQLAKRNKEATKKIEKYYDKKVIKDVREWAKESLLGSTVNHPQVGKIEFTSNGVKEAANQPHKNKQEKNYALYNIERLIADGKFIKSERDVEGRAYLWHYIEIDIVGGKSFAVIREDLFTKVKTFYSIVDKLK